MTRRLHGVNISSGASGRQLAEARPGVFLPGLARPPGSGRLAELGRQDEALAKTGEAATWRL